MSSQTLKQLKIKTSMLRRLRKEYESYDKETAKIGQKIEEIQSQIKNNPTQDTEIVLRKNKQFLGESVSVMSNVKQKLIEAFEGLATFLNEKGTQESINGSEEKLAAQNLVLEVETFLENIQ